MDISRDEFKQQVEEAVKRNLPDVTLADIGNFTLRMQHGEYWLELYLGNFYSHYLKCPIKARQEYLTGVLQPFIDDLNRGRGVSAADIAANLESIYPLVVGKQDLDNSLVSQPLTKEVHMVYVFDQGLRFFFIDRPTLAALKMDLNRLDELSRANFHRDLDKPLLLLDKKRGIVGYNYLDSYDSTRVLLLLKKFSGIEDLLGEEVLVMIPNRDLVMIFGRRNEPLYKRIQMLGRSEYINNPYPVTDCIYRLKDGMLVKYE